MKVNRTEFLKKVNKALLQERKDYDGAKAAYEKKVKAAEERWLKESRPDAIARCHNLIAAMKSGELLTSKMLPKPFEKPYIRHDYPDTFSPDASLVTAKMMLEMSTDELVDTRIFGRDVFEIAAKIVG